MSSTWGRHAPPTPINALNHDVFLDIFHWYRLGNTTNGFDRGWKLERWWFKLIHVCRTWRNLILASPTSLDLHLVCTYGTPVTTMLTHSPPLPLIIYYPGGLGALTGEDVEDVLFLLQHRERVRRIHIEAPAESLLDSMDGEYPVLQHLVIRSHTRKRRAMEVRAKLQAPLLRHLTLSDVRLPVGSELLIRAEGLVMLELLDVADSLEAHPGYLVAQLARMAQLERLVVHFRTALPNRKVERALSSARTTRAALPRLKLLSFRGGSAYLEGILSRINAPSLQTLSLNFFAQLSFDLPCLVHFVSAAQEPSLSSTAYAEGDGTRFQFEAAKLDFDAEAACLLLYSRATDPGQAGTITNQVQLRVSCRTLDWQLAVFAQICGALAPLLERVERLTLGLHISHASSDANSSPDMDVDSDRAQWHTLLRAFGSTKTLELAGPRAQHLRWSLLPFPAELLPALQKLLGGNEELPASNEELPASNEELPADNGELLGSDGELLGGIRGRNRGVGVTFRKNFKNIGRAYREQATTLIEICRLYVDTHSQTYTDNDKLQNVLQLADAALSAAGRAGKGTTAEATGAFERVQEEIKRFGPPPPPRKGTPGSHRKKLLDPSTALESASKKDEKSTNTISKVKSAFKAPIPSRNTKKVNFVIVESLPHKERDDQLIIHQIIDNSTTAAEIVWGFSCFPEKSTYRITPKIVSKQNPHFYLHLSKDAASFDSKFHKDPLKDFSRGFRHGDKIFVVLDKSCRLFLDAAKPYVPRIFGNLWKPHETVILKDAGGILDSEDFVLRNIGESQDYWYRPSITDSSQRPVGLGYSGADSGIVNTPFANARAVIHAAVRAQGVDLLIRDRSRPLPPADSGWKLLPSPEASLRIQAPEDQTIPRLPATHLPQLEYPNPNSSAPSIGSSTLFATSTESNTSGVSPNMRANALNLSIAGSQVELLTGTLPTPPSAPPASLMIPSPMPGPDRELLSVPRIRRKDWFRAYVYDYDP
ncbi:hypothetical protein EDB85DRAFT_2283374 [Lactarius pseudohatsudake]|nr:hypothetical protein EDB85DRAFT_2283374 [Lactarius pseudohatsudake]